MIEGQQIRFQFTDHKNHNRFLHCQICSQLMLKPIRLHRCGHTLCHSCSQSAQVKLCPICLQKIHSKQKDILATRLVGELEVKCKNNDCPWKGTFEDYQNIHGPKCKLKEGGLQGWLKGLKQILGEQKDNKQKGNTCQINENKQDCIVPESDADKQIDKLHKQLKIHEQVNNHLVKQSKDAIDKEMNTKKIDEFQST